MSMDPSQPYTSPQGVPPIPPKPGMSGGARLLVILGIVFVVLLVLCCGGFGLIAFFTTRYVNKSVSQDPQAVRQVTAQIAEMEVPEGLAPAFSLDMKVPFSEQRLMTWVAYADKNRESMLVLASFGEGMGAQHPETVKSRIRESMREQGLGQRREAAKPQEVEEKKVMVRGKPETFTFARSKGTDSSKARVEVTGMFEGKNRGIVMFLFSGDAEKYDDAAIVKIIESIR